jgi:hypothetical protein
MPLILYPFCCIYVSAQRAGPETRQNDYDNTVTGLCRIERNVCSFCQHMELLNGVYNLT